tara:strand:+ start:718 stop:1179 length:462 start_codon:yes stop_codon:yes gene_type:complete
MSEGDGINIRFFTDSYLDLRSNMVDHARAFANLSDLDGAISRAYGDEKIREFSGNLAAALVCGESDLMPVFDGGEGDRESGLAVSLGFCLARDLVFSHIAAYLCQEFPCSGASADYAWVQRLISSTYNPRTKKRKQDAKRSDDSAVEDGREGS